MYELFILSASRLAGVGERPPVGLDGSPVGLFQLDAGNPLFSERPPPARITHLLPQGKSAFCPLVFPNFCFAKNREDERPGRPASLKIRFSPGGGPGRCPQRSPSPRRAARATDPADLRLPRNCRAGGRGNGKRESACRPVRGCTSADGR